jgi:hypothetical protein
MPTRKIRNVKLEAKEYEELLKLQNKLKTKNQLEKIIKSSGYKSLPNYRKKEILDKTLKKSQQTARNILFNTNKRLQKEYLRLEKQKFKE